MAGPPAGSFTQVSAGGDHTCGFRTDGSLSCWGKNWYGQASPPAGAFTQVGLGQDHTCGLKSDGSLVCWGLNADGQAAPPTGTFSQMNAGEYHTCALKEDGTGTCWGRAGPFPPIDLNSSRVSQTGMNILWTDASSDETEFRVERSPDGKTGWMEIGATTGSSYMDSGLAPGAACSYRVRTYRSSDEAYSMYSNIASGATQEFPYRLYVPLIEGLHYSGQPGVF
jgi:hypothetical protein